MRLCRAIPVLFGVLWFLALGVLAIGTFGWFGQEPDPLSGVYLILLGAPWVQLVSDTGLPGPLVGILAPRVNLAIVTVICHLLSRRDGNLG
jgi:hypothetical protein